MSETLSGVTQLKIRDICLYIICLEECMSFLYFDSGIFCISLVVDSIPNFTKKKILWFTDHYPYHPRIELFTVFEFSCGCT